MKRPILYCYMVIMTIGVAATACTSTNTKTDEQQITAMDSVSTDLEKTNKELEEEAKKLEASLEKAEKEFNTSK